MKRTILALTIATTYGTNLPSFANEKDIWLAGFSEYYSADKNKFEYTPQDNSNLGWGFEMGERLNQTWGWRFEFARIELDAFADQPPIDGNRFGLDALYYINESNTYVFTGLKQQGLDKSYGLVNLGIGKHWQLSKKWQLITEVAGYHDFGQAHKDYSAKIGLAYHFGESNYVSAPKPALKPTKAKAIDADNDGVEDNVDHCPNTQFGVAVDIRGCEQVIDTDQDGIVDAKDHCPNTPLVDKVDEQGCTLFKETQDSIKLAVAFEQNSSDVKEPDSQDLQRFADFMKRYPEVSAQIEGHSSATGEDDYNLWLSQQRAEAIRSLLITHYDIAENRITAIGYGEARLLDRADSVEAHRTNRRIEARLVVNKREKVAR